MATTAAGGKKFYRLGRYLTGYPNAPNSPLKKTWWFDGVIASIFRDFNYKYPYGKEIFTFPVPVGLSVYRFCLSAIHHCEKFVNIC